MTVRKAVIPVAGLGTRMLPASKGIPKELLTVVDKPTIQYVVEEAAAAGITDILLVSHPTKGAIERHFAKDEGLESTLQAKGKTALLEAVQAVLPAGVSLSSVMQHQADGLGHAVALAADWVGDAPFAVLLPDVLVDSATDAPDLGQMLAAFDQHGHAQIMVETVPEKDVNKYGIVDPRDPQVGAGKSTQLNGVVEKPEPEEAPSQLAVIGRYVFPAAIMPLLADTKPGKGGEIQLTDAIDELIQTAGVDAWRMTGQTFDCGNKLGYLEAVLHYALKHETLGQDVQALVKSALKTA